MLASCRIMSGIAYIVVCLCESLWYKLCFYFCVGLDVGIYVVACVRMHSVCPGISLSVQTCVLCAGIHTRYIRMLACFYDMCLRLYVLCLGYYRRYHIIYLCWFAVCVLVLIGLPV